MISCCSNHPWFKNSPKGFCTPEVGNQGGVTSHHAFDPYSLAHVCGGVLQYIFIPPVWLGLITFQTGFWINMLLHAAFEMVENNPFCIRFCQTYTIDTGYVGDSFLNSVVDLLCGATGFLTAHLVYTRFDLVGLVILFLFICAAHLSFYPGGCLYRGIPGTPSCPCAFRVEIEDGNASHQTQQP